jgi:hypothetical protein
MGVKMATTTILGLGKKRSHEYAERWGDLRSVRKHQRRLKAEGYQRTQPSKHYVHDDQGEIIGYVWIN